MGSSDEKEERVTLLDSGADDYILKPFYVEELLARIRVAERHISFIKKQMVKDEPVFRNGKLIIDYSSGCTYLGENELYLTPTEYKLLCILSQNVGKVLTRNYLTQKIWGRSWDSDTYSLRVFIASLRKKLNSKPNTGEYIQTFTGTGYSGYTGQHSQRNLYIDILQIILSGSYNPDKTGWYFTHLGYRYLQSAT